MNWKGWEIHHKYAPAPGVWFVSIKTPNGKFVSHYEKSQGPSPYDLNAAIRRAQDWIDAAIGGEV